MEHSQRANFGSKLGIILATAGSAVGLGNVWRFPYMVGDNGGGVFIVVYIVCMLLLGIAWAAWTRRRNVGISKKTKNM